MRGKYMLADEFKVQKTQIENTIKLIDEGNTIPFIARYRKEVTGSLDDQILRDISDRLTYLNNLKKRKEEVSNSIITQEKMTDEIALSIENAKTLTELDDIYRPFKQKRKTRASMAREKGLEPLAEYILAQELTHPIYKKAEEFITEEVPTIEDAITGALDIIAETISDDPKIRKLLRALFIRTGQVVSKVSDEKVESVYTMYYDYSEPVNKIAGHRVLALDRGERDDVLKVSVAVNEDECISLITKNYKTAENELSDLVYEAAKDSFSRLIFPSVEREIRNMLTENACEQAIKVFAQNLQKLLMQPPMGNTVTLAVDPAYRTGCKVAVVNEIGKVLDTTVIYPTPPQNKTEQAATTLLNLIKKHNVTVICIGNGTASRESEAFIADMIKTNNLGISYTVVSEAGASVYSASKLAATEFPDYDVSLRSAISIARRLQDPLAELVKIDPKAIGVGQYQHDMPKNRLSEALEGVVENCVNTVGVDLNTASHSLLSYIAGINSAVAKNIVAYREENGAFTSRKQLMKVPKLGAKAFTQCAGFLRVSGGDEILDNTSVHPESYKAANIILKECGFTSTDLKANKIVDIKQIVNSMGEDNLAQKADIGKPTLNDIVSELLKPGRDPRDELPKPILRSDVLTMQDLKPGMELKGTVRNVIDFGAFVDIGVHEDGLVHISQICDKYIKHPLEVLNVSDIVTVWVMEVDMKRKRISLTMKPQNANK